MGTLLNAIINVLAEAKEPLHYQDITEQIIEQKLWQTDGQTPWQTVNATISLNLRDPSANSKIIRVGRGVYTIQGKAGVSYTQQTADTASEDDNNEVSINNLSFTEAARYVLDNDKEFKPICYREIMKIILDKKLTKTESKNPERTLYSAILQEVERSKKRGETPRFFIRKGGFIGLTKWDSEDVEGEIKKSLAVEIEKHNDSIRANLLNNIRTMEPYDLEKLVGLLLEKMKFEDIQVTQSTRDGGVDVRATSITGIVPVRLAIQVKKWTSKVDSATVQSLRGALKPHERGVIVTTSDFTADARKEASVPEKTPIDLINGEEFVSRLIEYRIGVNQNPTVVLELVGIDLRASSDESTL